MIPKDVKKVAFARLDEGMSTAEVAKFVGVTQRSVQKWKKENRHKENKTSRPEVQKIVDI